MGWNGHTYRCDEPSCLFNLEVAAHPNGNYLVQQHRLEHTQQQHEPGPPVEPVKASTDPLPAPFLYGEVHEVIRLLLASHYRDALRYALAARESDRLTGEYREGVGA